MAKKKKRSGMLSEHELHERRRYGFFWYDWLWKLLRPVLVLAASFVIVCGLVYTGYQKINELFFAPMDVKDTQTVAFEVSSGSSLSTVSRNLEAAGLIHNHTVFKYMADFMGMGQKIQSGDYELSRAMSAADILDQLISGDGKPLTAKITIIPGWTVENVADYLVDQDILDSAEEFLALCRTGESYSGYYFIEEMMKTADYGERLYALEGYLSPNTYEIYTSSSADTIIKRLLSQTEAAYSLAYDERAQEMGMTMDEVFTLASMIEKEAKTADFAKVSAVFHNRLKKGMTLGSDVTIKYVSGSEKMVIIPNKDHIDDLDKCLESLYGKTTYKNFEVIVCENNSTEESTFEYYKKAEAEHDNLKVVYYKGGFNFSAINNFAIKQAKGDMYLMLNNDIEIINGEWLSEMVSLAIQPNVGIVGAMLYYPDDTVQHAGVITGLGGFAGHSHKYHRRGKSGYMFRLSCVQNLSCVTAANLLVTKEAFDAAEGLDEEFTVAFNDVDFCLRIRDMGWQVLFTPYAMAYHHESKSRGSDKKGEKKERFEGERNRLQNRHGKGLLRDPFYNPNLTLDMEDFSESRVLPKYEE